MESHEMDTQNAFFTWQSLATLAGTATATTAIVNGLRQVIPSLGSAAWLGLILALILCLIGAVVDPQSGQLILARPFATYLIAVINGFFVFASATGLSAGGATLVHGSAAPIGAMRGAESGSAIGPRKSVFWQRWL
jgi:hypothetical protein